ncbi:MAG TPA: sulfotransferase [Pirellulales bacterium]|nr:sulfotransferase [Pirellulales bacterium]
MPCATVDRPIFVIGSGRCGSTIFHQALSHHPHVGFLTSTCASHPTSLWRNRLVMRSLDAPLVGGYLRRRFPANEHWAFWNQHLRGFSRPCRDLLAEDVRPAEASRMRRLLSGLVAGRRRRLSIKLTGWPRIGFLARIFPDAYFIHLVRDGRAVVNSLLNVEFWQGWAGPTHWGWGDLTAAEEEEWLRSGKSFAVLAAIQWKRHMDAFAAASNRILPSRYMELQYEGFVADPSAVLSRVLQFCQLEPNAKFQARVASLPIESKNYKWREELTQQQQLLVENSLRDHLLRYGYDVSTATAGGEARNGPHRWRQRLIWPSLHPPVLRAGPCTPLPGHS